MFKTTALAASAALLFGAAAVYAEGDPPHEADAALRRLAEPLCVPPYA